VVCSWRNAKEKRQGEGGGSGASVRVVAGKDVTGLVAESTRLQKSKRKQMSNKTKTNKNKIK
jgi:hypothetical protein